jgi:hypothetical protein
MILFLLIMSSLGSAAELHVMDKLSVPGLSTLGRVSQGAAETERFYPCVVSDSQNGTVSGAWIIHSPIPRASDAMFRIRVHGYANGDSDDVDFTVAGYATHWVNGSVDGLAGAVTAYDISDKGTDKWRKHVGIDASGNLAVAFGDADSSAAFYRLSADAWVTFLTTGSTEGWSIDRSQAANFGWKDIHTLEAPQFTGGEALSADFKYAAGLSDWRNNSGTCAAGVWCDIPDRTLSYAKRRAGSLLQITYQDTLGTYGTSYDQCNWRILVDGNTVGFFTDADIQSGGYYNSGSPNYTPYSHWRMVNTTHMALASGYGKGGHTIKVQSYRATAPECLQGWYQSGSFLSVEEVGP